MTLLKVREKVMDRFRPLLRHNDFTEQQWRVLRVLHECGEVDSTHLAKRANVLIPSLTRILRLLEARDLVKIRRDEEDRRRVLARLAVAGVASIHDMSPHSHAVYREIESAFGKDRVTNLLDELDALMAALDALDGP